MNDVSKDILKHYGVKRRSGRYPWGSGEDPYQHGGDFLTRVEALKKEGWTETAENIRKQFGLSTTDYRTEVSLCKAERKQAKIETAERLRDKEGLNPTEIGRRMGVNESTVRGWLQDNSKSKISEAQNVAEFLKERIKNSEHGMVDIGTGVERELGISKERLNQAVYLLQKEGYGDFSGRIDQINNKGKATTQRVLCDPSKEHKDIFDLDKIETLNDYTSIDDGESFQKKIPYPKSMDSSRLMINYKETGGIDKDGVIEVRRGCEDLYLGDGTNYCQARILVDGTHYLKGMAVYADDLPDGVDIRFNTNKGMNKTMQEVLKPIKDDPDNPFGSVIKEVGSYIDKDGNVQQSLINKRATEGDWGEWADALPSQFLSKQSTKLAQQQLDITKTNKETEFEEICSLTNPALKQHYLEAFAKSCDAAAVDLKAAALPGQKYHVILPLPDMNENECYCPKYPDGTKLALVRFPHAGTFEIPIVTVNNKNARAKDIMGVNPEDAIGIHPRKAEQLSGADFDGDTVLTIPTHNGKVKISNKSPLEELKDFDSKDYQYDSKSKDPDGTEHYYRNGSEFRVMRDTQKQMGVISNLITDMQLGGASDSELARAAKHSMVVIDAEKHKLDYKTSERENNIAELRNKYQRTINPETGELKIGGASTLISRAKGETSIYKTQGEPKINIKGKPWYDPKRPEGSLIYKTTDDLWYPDRSKVNKDTGMTTIRTADGKKISYNTRDPEAVAKYSPQKRVDKDGNVTFTSPDGKIQYAKKARLEQTTRMKATDDARALLSANPTRMELLYAEHANSMKNLANRARIELSRTNNSAYNREAARTYKNEVASLDSKLNTALLNAGRERAAQRQANVALAQKKAANPGMSNEDLRKAGQKALNKARQANASATRSERNITITDKEWEAIQNGAISHSKLKKILSNSDPDVLRQKAMPKEQSRSLSAAQISNIQALIKTYPASVIAEKYGISTSAVYKYAKGSE